MRAFALLLLMLACGFAQAREPLRVLMIGNSLTYTNDLPAMLTAVAASQPSGIAIETTSFVEPGGSLARRWLDGAAVRALESTHWDAVVLQERGGVEACLVDEVQRSGGECRASIVAHRAFAKLARERGARVLLLETWYPAEAAQARLHEGTLRLARQPVASVVHAGDALQALARRDGRASTFPDGLHPGPAASLVMAAQLYRTLTGEAPVPATVRIDFALMPAASDPDPQRPLEEQRVPARQPLVFAPEAVRPLFELAARYR